MDNINIFDVICLAFSIISIFISVIQFVRKHDLVKALEGQMIALIGNIDSLCANAKDANYSQKEIAAKSIAIRGQAIGVLKTFSKRGKASYL